MRRVDDQHGVELETDRPRLNAAHAGQEHGAEQLLIAGSFSHLIDDAFHEFVARRVFEQTDERFNFGAERDEMASGFVVVGGRGGQAVQESEVAESGDGARLQRARHETSSIEGVEHERSPSPKGGGAACC